MLHLDQEHYVDNNFCHKPIQQVSNSQYSQCHQDIHDKVIRTQDNRLSINIVGQAWTVLINMLLKLAV